MMHSNSRKGFQTSLGKILLSVRVRLAKILASIATEIGRWPAKAMLSCLLLGVWQVHAADNLSEAQIKAAYLLNFAKFVEWPAEALPPHSEMVLCIAGNNVLNGTLEALDGHNVGEHPLHVVQKNYTDLSVTGCHLLYIGSSEQAHFLVILSALGNAPTLTLSDIDDFAEKGGGIGLLFRDNKVVFEVNLESIRKAGLHLPGQLLNIASYVYGR
ncbi:hypothetical protein Metme_3738 [Methylomonas methanica MC09]|uniref:Transmembrane protein n=1 Tax=Methylomonas methanica (strain DSM 25384 / MC09) TaxID=857087 RepID=F9ZWT4_METMM|nr:hypothetical protein Metme_3738 [Methylomonas methanica MC09]